MIVKEQAATGIGGGQVNRIWPTKQALERSAAIMKAASEETADTGGSPWKDNQSARVLASDAFFPFADVVEAAAAVFTGTRHFKH